MGRSFGNDGGVIISLYETFPDGLNFEEPLFVCLDGLAVPLFMESFERHGRAGALVRFADIDTPERAAELVGKEIFSKAPEGDNFEDFEGWQAVMGGLRGEIIGFIDGANPLFRIDAEGKELLIPAAFVENADPEAKSVSFTLPEGLLELYL